MKKLVLMAVMTALMSINAIAQYKVHFQVNDSTGEGEAFATVRLYAATNTRKVISTGVTALNGTFGQSLASAGTYKVEISAVGKVSAEKEFSVDAKHPTADLGTIVLAASANMLTGVTVTASAPVVKSEIDRITYNVPNDDDSKTRTVPDMLRKVPLVTVDAQDNIKVKGSSSFKIYKNGHPDPAMSNNAKDVLKAIPASMIKRIEVITDPGAKYDAEASTMVPRSRGRHSQHRPPRRWQRKHQRCHRHGIDRHHQPWRPNGLGLRHFANRQGGDERQLRLQPPKQAQRFANERNTDAIHRHWQRTA